MKILIIGAGYVGLVTGICLAEKGNQIICQDKNHEKIKQLKEGKSPIYEKGLEVLLKKNIKKGTLEFQYSNTENLKDVKVIFICVGTPEKENGQADLKYVYDAVDDLTDKLVNDCIIIIKSTVPVGTGNIIKKRIEKRAKKNINVEIVSNPEFLSQGNAIEDSMKKQRIIIGVNNKKTIKIMKEIYKNFEQKKIITSIENAELIKYASNAFLALKISYINSIANLCEKTGTDIQIVAKGMGLDKRIGNSFLQAGIGYGGSCFPKDTKALLYMAKKNNINLKLIEDTIRINEKQNIVLIEKSKKLIQSFKNIKVAILGLTFKPNTDDIREAPAIKNIKNLMKEGAQITAYDPIGIKKCKQIFPQIMYSYNIEEAIKDAKICFIFTEWNEIKKFDIKKYKKLMENPLIFDGRNCYNAEEMKKARNRILFDRKELSMEEFLIELAKAEIIATNNFIHGIDHITRVYDYSVEVSSGIKRELNEKEKKALKIAVYWHDIGRVDIQKYDNDNDYDHAENSAESLLIVAKRFNMQEDEIIKLAISAIRNHRRSKNNEDKSLIIDNILWDADKLDSINSRRIIRIINDYKQYGNKGNYNIKNSLEFWNSISLEFIDEFHYDISKNIFSEEYPKFKRIINKIVKEVK